MSISHRSYIFVSLALLSVFSAVDSSRNPQKQQIITYPTIYVNAWEEATSEPFKQLLIQCLQITKGGFVYTSNKAFTGARREQIRIPYNKQFVYLKGDGKRKTYVVWDAHDSIATSATFTSQADNIIAKSITFVNSYNSGPGSSRNPMRTAVAAMIEGDKSAFYRCGFIGFQDTLWDVQGRHFFKRCTVQGAVDFIFGAGQSLYERCTISVVAGALNGVPGYVTAQARSHPNETNGFVFKDCNIIGNGKTYLGRPWRDYARVIFYNTSMSDIIVPQGWDAWYSTGNESQLSFVEQDCRGLGSNTSRRVKWANKLSRRMVRRLNNISFIDNEGWMSRLAINMLI